jgi:GAF domain-containing protein/HAMP domain-containing protein
LEKIFSGQKLNPPFQRILFFIFFLGTGTILFYLAVFLQTKNFQVLILDLLILLAQAAFVLLFTVSFRRDRINIAGTVLLLSLAINFVGHELIWTGITFYLSISGILLIILAGILILPKQWPVWFSVAFLYMVVVLLVNLIEPIQRLEPNSYQYASYFIIGSSLISNLAVIFLLILELPIHSLRVRLIGTFVLLVIVPVALVGTVATIFNAQNTQSAVLRHLEAVASLKESAVDTWLNNIKVDFETISSTFLDIKQVEELISQGQEKSSANQDLFYTLEQRLKDRMQRTGFFNELMIVNLNGEIIVSTDPSNLGKSVKGETFFTDRMEGTTIFPPITIEGQGNALYVAKPIQTTDGQTIALLAGKANLDPLNRIMIERIGLGNTGETYLVNRSHHLVTDSFFEGYKAGESYLFSPAIDQALYKNQNGTGSYIGYRVKNVLGVFHWLPELGVALLAEQERSEALRSTYQGALINIGLMLASMAAAFVIGYFATTRITNPLAKLVKTTEQIAAGNLQLAADVEQLDEIGDLSNSFNSMAIQLRGWVTSLEQRVADRTRDLENRSRQLRMAAEINREVTAIQDLYELLRRAVILIHDRFGLYHVAIFLVDDQMEYAVLMAGTGEAGKKMLERGYRVKVGEAGGIPVRSTISYVAQSGQPRISLDVSNDPGYYVNPLLPDIKSEAVLPLKVGTNVIGVINFQSAEKSIFDEETVYVLQIMSDQLAVAILNIRLLTDMTKNIEEMQRMYGTYTHESWRNYQQREFDSLNNQNSLGYRHYLLETEPISSVSSQIREAIQIGQPVIQESETQKFSESEVEANQVLAVPIKVRGQTIGAIEIQISEQAISPDIVTLYEEVANRLALILENARLLQEAQGLALREQQINMLSSNIRNSVNLDTILQNTVREIGKAFGSTRTFVFLGNQFEDADQVDSFNNQLDEEERGR